jgi:hypothetical protein
MKSKLIFTVILLGSILTMGSCNKWLDLEPEDGILKENFWKTKEQIKSAVMGCYASLLGSPSGGPSLARQFFLWGELRADMLAPSLGISNEELQVMNMNIDPSNSITDWSSVYETINYCNTVIKFAPGVLDYDQTLSEDQMNAYVAEAEGLRALMYFYLVRSFGDVPLKLTPTASDDDLVSPAKNTQAEVLAQILKDLSDAEGKAATTYGDQADDKGRITRYTINAIQADVYLWMDNYQACIAACDKIINSHAFGLIPASAAWFNTVYRTGNSNESIFEFQFYQQKTNPFFDMFGVSDREFIAANRVMDDVFTTPADIEPYDIRSDGASVKAEDGTIWKFIGLNATDMVSSDDSYTHWFVYRYPDILLMKAEAEAWTGQGEDALRLVKLVRDRARALPGTDEAPDPTDAESVARFILDERAREFMFEGKRWYDVLRYAKRNNYADMDYLLDMVSNMVPADMVHTTQAKLQDHNSLYFPIYQKEMQADKNLVQNPFYQ